MKSYDVTVTLRLHVEGVNDEASAKLRVLAWIDSARNFPKSVRTVCDPRIFVRLAGFK